MEYAASMLLWAAYHGQTEVVKTFLMVGGNCEQPKVHVRGSGLRPHVAQNGNSPLQWAAMRGHVDIVKVLAAAGAKLEHENQVGTGVASVVDAARMGIRLYS